MAAEYRQTLTGSVVQKLQIIGTQLFVFSAWRLASSLSQAAEQFSSLTSDDQGNWLGQIGRQRLPEELDALPAYSDQRSAAVRAWHQRLYSWAYEEIVTAFPEAADVNGHRSMGEISIVQG